MAQSVGAVALDIVMGKNTVGSVVRNSMIEVKKEMSSATSTITSKGKAIGKACTSIGASLMPLTVGIGSVGIAVGKMGADFEDAMAKVSTIADTTEVPMKELEKSILDLSNQTGVSAGEIADNVYNAISAGQKTGDAVNFVTRSTKLAKAGFADAGASLDVLTTILNSYGMEASEVTNVSDMLIQTQNKGKTTVAELSSTMGKVIPTANAYSVGLDNVCASYAILTSNGIATAESTTYMNSMLNELGKSGTDVSNILKEQTGKSFKSLMDDGASVGDVLGILQQYCKDTGIQFSDLWSSAEAGKAALVLAKDGVQGFNTSLTDMQNSTGATDEAFSKMETTSAKLEKTVNRVKNTAIGLGGVLLDSLGPIIDGICAKIDSLTGWFNSLNEDQKNLIVTIALVVGAIAPVAIVIGKVISGVAGIITAASGFVSFVSGTVAPALSSFFAFLAANPIVLIIAAIIGAIILLVTHWDKVKVAAGIAWDFICNIVTAAAQTIGTLLSELCSFITSLWTTITTFLTNAINNIVTFVTTTFGGMFQAIVGIFNGILTFFSGIFEIIKNLFFGYILIICDILTGDFTKLKSDIMGIWNNIKSGLSSIISGIQIIVVNIFSAIKEFIKGTFSAISTIALSIWRGISSTITGIISGMRSTAINIFNSMLSGIRNVIGTVRSVIVSGFTNAFSFIKSIPSQAVGWGKDMIQGIINGIRSMIGSVGSAVKGVADKIRSFLHFSVPDEGPLTDYESWMPDFMTGMAKGITNNIPLIENAVKGVTNSMQIGVETPEITGVSGTVKADQPATGNDLLNAIKMLIDKLDNPDNTDNQPVQIILDGRVIDEYELSARNRRFVRSGGMA